ncbi:ABC transporter permease [Turneriella parva]|uniref:Cytochrome c-type biogenesis protein CcmB n=1 Tax=Turneriella parva (strain ATCC BAA-1111 / DSM 21527 / NCTC 11395 / H) TaxID=869212 RepID=I4B3N8_TURPD|nr:ABC transporter permease [Turneriella parva]AFM11895.1 hypothetical protein Turpa_1247 [Turneriella parva DSM 21527]
MRVWWALVKNEFKLYRAQRGLQLAFVLTLALLAMFRFGLSNEVGVGSALEVFPVVAYCIASLQLLLMAIDWESEGFAYRYYAMHRVSLSSLFFAKSAVSFVVQIPLWIFSVIGYFLLFPATPPDAQTTLLILLTALPLGLALAPAGQLIAAIAQHSAQKNFLAIALFLPLCLPVFIAATGRLGALLAGIETVRYDALMAAAALVFIGAGNLLFGYLFEE